MGVAEKRRLKKKLAKEKKKNSSLKVTTKTTKEKEGEKKKKSRKGTPTVEVEYVAAPLETILDADVSEEMRRVFEAFLEKPANDGEKTLENDRIHEEKKKTKKKKKNKKKNGGNDDEEFSESSSSDDDDDDAEDDDDEKNNPEDGLTRKQRKEMKKLQIADLKRVCEKPEVVEIWDTTAQDPEFLVYIKASRNAVPVPETLESKESVFSGEERDREAAV